MKLPPKEKVYEAFSCIADGRIAIDGQSARVQSSDGTKTYTVRWRDNIFASDDNATYWQGYPGYPVIAVLLLTGRLRCQKELMEPLKGIAWKQLNDQYKRNYEKACAQALADIEEKETIIAYAEETYAALAELDLTIKRRLPA